MSVHIGEFLFKLREERKVSAKEICEGICNVSSYSNYERDQRIPDFLTLDFLMERLGCGITGLTVYVSKEQMEYLKWRKESVEILQKRQWEKLEEHIFREPVKCHGLNKMIKKQHLLYLKGVQEEVIEKNIKKAKEFYKQALECTCPFLINQNQREKYRIGKTEMGIYTLYLRLVTNEENEENETNEVIQKLEALLEYQERILGDANEKAMSYSHLVCIWGQCIQENIYLYKKEQILEKAYEMLKRQRKLFHVTEILSQLIVCKEKLGKKCEAEKKIYGTLCQVYDLFKKDTGFNPFEFSANEWMFALIDDYLGKNRMKKRLTQEVLSDGICAVESYSRIESGKRTPNRSNYKAITEKLGVEPRYMMELIDTGNYKAVILRREISKAMFEGKYTDAGNLLRKLEKEIDITSKVNVQYLEERKASCSYGLKEISSEEHIAKLKKILAYTLEIDDIGKKNHLYIRTEINIINQLAALYHKKKDYVKGIEILQGFLEDMQNDAINIEQRFKETYLAALNLDKFLADVGRYEEAYNVCFKWAKKAVCIGHAAYLDDYLAEMSYNMDHMERNMAEKSKALCKLALDFSAIYGTKKNQEEIENYYKKRYCI